MLLLRLLTSLLIALLAVACTSENETTAASYSVLVPGSPLHSPNGLTLGPDGYLYAGSVASQTIFRVDPASGEVSVVVPPPAGEADDIAFSPDGQMAWTALVAGEIRTQLPDGQVAVLVPKQRLINPIDYTSDGRLFAGQMAIDRLYEFSADAEPRLVTSKQGNLNSFEITADGQLFGPLLDKGAVAKIDIETGDVSLIAEGLGKVVAVNLDPDGRVWAIDWVSGDLWRIDPGAQDDQFEVPVRVATLVPPLDNLAVGQDGTVFVTRPAHSAIDRVDPDSGEVQSLVPGELAGPGGLTVIEQAGREVLLVADAHAWRLVDMTTGEVTAPTDLTQFGYPNAATHVVANADYFGFTHAAGRGRVYLVDRQDGKTATSWVGLKRPYGIVLGSDGDPIVADFDAGTIIGLSRSDRRSKALLAEDLKGPVGLAWAGPKSVYVTEATGGTLLKVSLDGGGRTSIATGLLQPEGIHPLADGRIAVVEVGRQRVIAIDPADGTITVLAEELPVGEGRDPITEPVYLPSDVTQASDGSLYLTGDRNNSVIRVALD
ncbi:MAG: Vgb family protein [Gammaproteobacteria bacterium]